MFQRTIMAETVLSDLTTRLPDVPVHYFAPEILSHRLAAFQAGFPGMVTYAVKANPADEVISLLAAAGMTAFDVASPEEIALITRLVPGAALHYNNPVRSKTEILAGIAAGVASWSVDDAVELEKLAGLGATGEIAVRFKLTVAGAAYNFGSKFGALEQEAVLLLRRAVALGFSPALTFHVGTQCTDPAAWQRYIEAAHRIALAAGITIKRLNVGGGFPAGRDGAPVDHSAIFDAIIKAMDVFDTQPDLICEPGRGLVADAFSYAVRVKSVRSGRVYLNDGIYGGLSEFPSIGVPQFQVVGRDLTGETNGVVVFGPTCDSLDRLPGEIALPAALAEDDYIVFASTGAYLNGVTTGFNGYGARETVIVETL